MRVSEASDTGTGARNVLLPQVWYGVTWEWASVTGSLTRRLAGWFRVMLTLRSSCSAFPALIKVKQNKKILFLSFKQQCAGSLTSQKQ